MIRFKKQDEDKPAAAKPAPKAAQDTKPDATAKKAAAKPKKPATGDSATLDLISPDDRDA